MALTSPLTASVVAAFGPSIVFFFQSLDGNIPPSSWILGVTLFYAALSVIGVIIRALATTEENTNL